MIKQIGLLLRGRPILLIARMITDRNGLHSVLLLLIVIIIVIVIIIIIICETSPLGHLHLGDTKFVGPGKMFT